MPKSTPKKVSQILMLFLPLGILTLMLMASCNDSCANNSSNISTYTTTNSPISIAYVHDVTLSTTHFAPTSEVSYDMIEPFIELARKTRGSFCFATVSLISDRMPVSISFQPLKELPQAPIKKEYKNIFAYNNAKKKYKHNLKLTEQINQEIIASDSVQINKFKKNFELYINQKNINKNGSDLENAINQVYINNHLPSYRLKDSKAYTVLFSDGIANTNTTISDELINSKIDITNLIIGASVSSQSGDWMKLNFQNISSIDQAIQIINQEIK